MCNQLDQPENEQKIRQSLAETLAHPTDRTTFVSPKHKQVVLELRELYPILSKTRNEFFSVSKEFDRLEGIKIEEELKATVVKKVGKGERDAMSRFLAKFGMSKVDVVAKLKRRVKEREDER